MSDKVKSSAEMWDNRFAGEKFAYGKEPNVWLAERISEISPPAKNKALIPADGEEEMLFGVLDLVGMQKFLTSQPKAKSSVKCLLQNTVLALTTMLRT